MDDAWVGAMPTRDKLLRLTALCQGGYFLLTGVWPLVHIRSFEAVTGPKVDRWLVKTVGVLVAVVGAMLLYSTRREDLRRLARDVPEIPLVAVGTGAALSAVDTIYVAKGRIAPVYLLDTLTEAILIAGWVIGLTGRDTEDTP